MTPDSDRLVMYAENTHFLLICLHTHTVDYRRGLHTHRGLCGPGSPRITHFLSLLQTSVESQMLSTLLNDYLNLLLLPLYWKLPASEAMLVLIVITVAR